MSKQTTYEQRLNVLNNMFPSGKTRVTDDVKKWLISKGFLFVPYSLNPPSMRYNGSLFDRSVNVATTLQTITERLGLRWDQPDSPLIVGMFSSLYRLDLYLDSDTQSSVTAGTKHFCTVRTSDYLPSNLVLQQCIFYLATQFRLTKEEIFCILCGQDGVKEEEFFKAVKECPNVLFAHTANIYVDQCLSDGDI